MTLKPMAYERRWFAAMLTGATAGTAMAVFLLTRAPVWPDPVFTPILAACLAWLVLVPLQLVSRNRNSYA